VKRYLGRKGKPRSADDKTTPATNSIDVPATTEEEGELIGTICL